MLDSESDDQDKCPQNLLISAETYEEVAITSSPIEREVKIVEFTEQHEHVRRQKLLESMKSGMAKYNNKRSKDYIRKMNAKRKTTKEQNRKHVSNHYQRKRLLKSIYKKPSGIDEVINIDDLVGVPKKRQNTNIDPPPL